MPLFLSLLQERTKDDPARMKRALTGLRQYQEADRRPPSPPAPAIAARLGASLRDYGGEGAPVLFIPSLINPPNILDLSEERSLLRWLSKRGRRVLLLDWGWPGPDRQDLDIDGHVEQIALPLIEEVSEAVDLVGYCLGGTMAMAAARIAPARSLALIAAPWHFSRFPADDRARLDRLWADVRAAVERLGLLPMEALQSAFWSLDPERTIAKFEAFGDMDGDSAETFVILEDWANDGPPLSGAAAAQLFEGFFHDDRPGTGRWQVAGRTITDADPGFPVLNIVSTSDRIVPEATAAQVGQRIALDQGHVGMMVGSRARSGLWSALSRWLGCGD